MKNKILPLLFGVLSIGACAQSQLKLQLVNFASGFNLPLDIAHCGDSRLFVVERDGRIWVLDSLGVKLGLFLDIDPRVNSAQNEQGLLGLAFHPNYQENGYFFVNYTTNNGGATRVSRFSVMPNDPNKADPDSELIILEQSQPYWNHNGGCIKFGPDGYLYTGIGDGGSGGDPQNNGQNKKTFLGKILRIDVNNSSQAQPYAIPPDNPFVGNPDYSPEIWSLGWRNPWRFSFDRLTGDMWIADVGQNIWEEIDYEPAGAGGRNYGWRCYEGNANYNTNGCQPASSYTAPVFVYNHSGGNGCSVTGGFVYRGSKYPDLYGCYLFADYCSGRWWYMRKNADGTFTTNVLTTLSGYQYSSLGEDRNGELYVCLLGSGGIQRVTELCSSFQLMLSSFSGVSCINESSGMIELAASGATGNVAYTWSNGTNEALNANLPPGIYTVEAKDGNNCIRRDTFEILNGTPPTPQLNSSDTTVCQGQAFSIEVPEAPQGTSYLWFFNGTAIEPSLEGTFEAQMNGIFQVRLLEEMYACLSAFSPPFTLSVALVPTVFLSVSGNEITASVTPSNASLQWYFEGVPIANANESVLTVQESGLYQLRAVSTEGCESSAEVQVVVSSAKMPASVLNYSLSPNPSEQHVVFEIEIEAPFVVHLTLADTNQRQLWAKALNGQKIVHTIDLAAFPPGTYFLSVRTDKAGFVRRILKQ